MPDESSRPLGGYAVHRGALGSEKGQGTVGFSARNGVAAAAVQHSATGCVLRRARSAPGEGCVCDCGGAGAANRCAIGETQRALLRVSAAGGRRAPCVGCGSVRRFARARRAAVLRHRRPPGRGNEPGVRRMLGLGLAAPRPTHQAVQLRQAARRVSAGSGRGSEWQVGRWSYDDVTRCNWLRCGASRAANPILVRQRRDRSVL